MQGDYDWAATFLVGACVLDFFSVELVGSKQTKLHVVHHDYMAACLLILNLDQIVMHSNVLRSGELVGLTVIITVVTIVTVMYSGDTWKKKTTRIQWLPTEALATYSDIKKWPLTDSYAFGYLVKLVM